MRGRELVETMQNPVYGVFRGSASAHHWLRRGGHPESPVFSSSSVVDPDLLGAASDPSDLVARNRVLAELAQGTLSFRQADSGTELGQKTVTVEPKQ